MPDGNHVTKTSPVSNVIAAAVAVGIPVASILLACSIGAVIMAFSKIHPADAYKALLEGAFGDPQAITRTLVKSTPLIYSGMALALGLKAGLFNIGAQGQLLFGTLAAALAGYEIQGLPALLHIALALLAGACAGGIYGGVQGALKAYTGAHEVITGIMLNYVAINFTEYIAAGPFRDTSPGNVLARTPPILETAVIPPIGPVPSGFIMAVAIAFCLWFFLGRTVIGFELTTVGRNLHAARYAGINVKRTIVLTMAFSGLLAGLGGAVETQGVVHRFQPGFNAGLGFDGITIALLARTHPLGIVPASILFGIMRAGAGHMQFNAGVAPEIVDVIQAMILFFVAADMVFQRCFGMDKKESGTVPLTSGWGKVA